MILNILIFIGTFFFMEFMAWFTHKYIMHGFMWYFHRDHHVHEPGFFERNDVFFLIFAVPSFLCIFTGLKAGGDFRVWIGAGIALYGLCYFLVHDVFIHQRFKWLRNSSNPYLLSLRRAHKIHHKHLGPQDGECFGMLVVPYKYWKESKRMVERQKTT
ncbi:MAG: sterol desaturase family protein [Flavobacteriales bacterium]|jgi:beta-carotene 3-hydroxylase|nr:sterol desaturase family protein [Flavobacteriales bacterium]